MNIIIFSIGYIIIMALFYYIYRRFFSNNSEKALKEDASITEMVDILLIKKNLNKLSDEQQKHLYSLKSKSAQLNYVKETLNL